MKTSITVTYDSIFDVESYIEDNIGMLTPSLYDWFFNRIEPDDIKQCSMTPIFKLMSTIISSCKTTTVTVVTYGVFDEDLRNAVITLFDTLFRNTVILRFDDTPSLSEYTIVSNIVKYMNEVNHPNETMTIYYNSSVYHNEFGKEEIDLIKKTLNPAETLAVDKKYFRRVPNGN